MRGVRIRVPRIVQELLVGERRKEREQVGTLLERQREGLDEGLLPGCKRPSPWRGPSVTTLPPAA